MKKQNVQSIESVMNEVINATSTKGDKQKSVTETATTIKPTRTETKREFVDFIRTKEDISLNKFFKLLKAFRTNDPTNYTRYMYARNMDIEIKYDFIWFSENCPKLDGKFAKWCKVTEKRKANENQEYNYTTEKGVQYTLVEYNFVKANWEQYISALDDVVRNIKRLQREKAKAEKPTTTKKVAETKVAETKVAETKVAETKVAETKVGMFGSIKNALFNVASMF